MRKELKPCPFCGSNRIVEETETDNSGCVPMTVWFVKCTACGSFKNSISNPDRAIKRWNTRPAEEALTAEVERLKAALHEIVDECEQERVYAHEIHEIRFIDEVEAKANFALTSGMFPTQMSVRLKGGEDE